MLEVSWQLNAYAVAGLALLSSASLVIGTPEWSFPCFAGTLAIPGPCDPVPGPKIS